MGEGCDAHGRVWDLSLLPVPFSRLWCACCPVGPSWPRGFIMRRYTLIGVLGAIAFAFMYLDFPIPPFPAYLQHDPGEVPALIAGFALGPAAGVGVELVKGLLISLLRPGELGGPFGIFMNLLAGITLVAVATSYY